MKRIALLLAMIILLCACQPTPEVDAVKQKDTNVLIDTVKTGQQEQQQAIATLPPAMDLFPARFTCDFTTSLKNVHVTADVPLEVLSDGVFPMLRVERRTLSDTERMTVAKRVFGTDDLYVWQYRFTRKDLENQIREYMREFTPEEKEEWMRDVGADEEAYQAMLERRRETLEDLKRQYNALPDDDSPVPLSRWDGSVIESENENRNYFEVVKTSMPDGDLYRQDHMTVYGDEYDRPMDYCVAWRNDSDVTWTGFFDNAHKFGTVRIDRTTYDKPYSDATVTPNEAIRTVQDIFAGVADIVPVDVYWANNGATDGEEIGVNKNTRWGYLIRFSQNYSGSLAPYCSSSVLERNPDALYTRMWRYETLAAVVDGEGNLISFDWFAPLKVTDTIAESTPLLPYEEIQRIFAQQMDRAYSREDHRDGTLTVDSVQLGLFRIREQNDMEHGLMVPAWFFTGTLTYSEQMRAARIKEGLSETQATCEYYDDLNPLCIINAIDGTIVDPMLGY